MILEPHELKQAYSVRGRLAAFARDTQTNYTHASNVVRGASKNPTYELLLKLTVYAEERLYFKINSEGGIDYS